MTISDSDRRAIVLAAVGAAGPSSTPDWEVQVAMAAARITAMLSEGSMISRAIEQVDASVSFPATILGVEIEKSSKRAVLTLRTRPSDRNPDGVEKARTERYDHPLGREMARRARSLTGHRVVVSIERESTSDGQRKVRVVRHLEDLGVDASVTVPDAGQQAQAS